MSCLGYSEYGGECQKCTGVRSDWIAGLVLVTAAFMVFLYYVSKKPRADTQLFFYYTSVCMRVWSLTFCVLCVHSQMVLLFYGSSNFVTFLNTFNFSLQALSSVCVVSISPAEQAAVGLVVPAICLGELIAFCLLHLAISRIPHPLIQHIPFRLSPYIRTYVVSFVRVLMCVFVFTCVLQPGRVVPVFIQSNHIHMH